MRVIMIHRPGNMPGGDVLAMRRYSEQLQRLGVDVTFAPADDLPPLVGYDFAHLWAACSPDWGLPAAQAVKAAELPLIVTPFWWSRHERQARAGLMMPPEYEGEVRELLALCDVQFTCTMAEAQQVWRLVPSLPAHVVGMGADRESIAPRAASDYVVAVGRVEPHKGQDKVATACIALGVPLVIVGTVTEADRALLEESGVKCTGHLPHDEMIDLLAGARVHALPAWFENPGIVHAEACLLGVPSVMGNRGCEPEFFGTGGHYCDPGDVNDVARAIAAAWHAPRGQWAYIPTWLDMAQNGLDWMEANV